MSGSRPASRRLQMAAVLSLASLAVLADGMGPARAAPNFDASPTVLSFPATYVGDSTSISVVVTNVSGTDQTVSMAGGASGDPNFGGSQNCQGKTLAPGGTCAVTYTFEPQTEGSASASTSFTINGESFSVSMSGTGLYPFSVAPTNLSFPDTAVGDTTSVPVVVTNVSGGPQTVSMAGGATGDPNFSGSQNCQGNTLSPGGTCEVTYTFQPQAAGALSANTSFSVNGTSFAITMSGTAIDPSTTTTTTTTSSTSSTTTATTTTTTTEPETPSTAPSPAPPPVISPIPGPITHGDSQVIAQGIVVFPDGPLRWDLQTLDAGGWPYEFDGSPPAFFIADGPDAVLVSDENGLLALLDAGEATFVPAGTSGAVAPLFDGAFTAAQRITFVGSDGPAAFVPGAGPRDVNLIRGVVGPEELVGVLSPFPVLVVVTEGEVADADGAVIDAAAGPVTLGPEVELTNRGTEAATVVIAAVGGAAG